MKQIVSQIWHSPSARNVGKLLSANVIAQAVGLLVYPLLTRLYSPEDFGLLNLFMSIGGVLVIFSTLEWYNAIVLPKKEEESIALVHLSLLCVAALALILFFTIPFAKPIAGLFKSPNLAKYYWMLPIYVLLMGAWNVLNFWYVRKKAYGRISGYQISQSLFSACYKVGMGYISQSGGLIYATILSPLCSLLLSASVSAKKYLRVLYKWNWNACKKAAKEYANFPKYSLPRVLLNTLAIQLPILLLTPLFGNALVGIWGMALLFAFVPINMLTKALYQVLYQQTTERVQKSLPVGKYYIRYAIIVIGGILLLQAVVFFPLPVLIQWLLGDGWRETGELIRWTFPWMLFYIMTFAIGFIPDIFAKQKIEFLYEIILAGLRVSGLLLGVYMENFEMAIAGYCIGSAIGTFARFVWQIVLVRQYDQSITPESFSKNIS